MKVCLLPVLILVTASPLAHSADTPGTLAPVLQSLVDKHIAPGVVVLVANKDGVLDLEKAGFASLATKTPMRDDSVFWIASMSKSLTATALMMLVDEGKVSLDDPVEKFLPEFKGQQVGATEDGHPAHPPAHPITVREIMNHTSGLVLANDKNLKHPHVLQGDVLEYAQRPLRQEPGTKSEYNNNGINTAGRIIEVVSGMSYADFMQARLFDPLGMKDTTCWPNEEQAGRLAHAARFTEDKTDLVELAQDPNVKPEQILKFSNGVPVPAAITRNMGFGIAFDYGKHYAMPAGGYFSTAHDLGRFCRMLLRGGELDGKRYLTENAVRTMSASQLGDVKIGPQESYGIGWSIKLTDEEGPGIGSFGHRGACRTAMWIDPKNGLALVILAERADMPGDQQKVMYGGFMKAAEAAFGGATATRSGERPPILSSLSVRRPRAHSRGLIKSGAAKSAICACEGCRSRCRPRPSSSFSSSEPGGRYGNAEERPRRLAPPRSPLAWTAASTYPGRLGGRGTRTRTISEGHPSRAFLAPLFITPRTAARREKGIVPRRRPCYSPAQHAEIYHEIRAHRCHLRHHPARGAGPSELPAPAISCQRGEPGARGGCARRDCRADGAGTPSGPSRAGFARRLLSAHLGAHRNQEWHHRPPAGNRSDAGATRHV